jgi:ABC-type sugar transport system substrate-binding protein
MRPNPLIGAPNERAPLNSVMRRAMDAGFPTICLERDIAEPDYTNWIRTDNGDIGREVSEFITGFLEKKYGEPRGRVVEIDGLKGVEDEINRQGGAHDVWAKYPKIEVVGEVVANWLQSNAKDRMAEILSAVPLIDVVYAHNEPMAMSAWLASREKGREKEMIFIGVDRPPGGGSVRKVKECVLAVTFIYPLCVDKAVEIDTRMPREPGFKPDKVYLRASHIVTAENAKQVSP